MFSFFTTLNMFTHARTSFGSTHTHTDTHTGLVRFCIDHYGVHLENKEEVSSHCPKLDPFYGVTVLQTPAIVTII